MKIILADYKIRHVVLNGQLADVFQDFDITTNFDHSYLDKKYVFDALANKFETNYW